jgi:hypothetical protein
MASRPPEGQDTNDALARNRWMVINAVRMGGLAMALIGILGLGHVFEYPVVAAYVLVAVGLADFFVMPLLLARKWRTPEQ